LTCRNIGASGENPKCQIKNPRRGGKLGLTSDKREKIILGKLKLDGRAKQSNETKTGGGVQNILQGQTAGLETGKPGTSAEHIGELGPMDQLGRNQMAI